MDLESAQGAGWSSWMLSVEWDRNFGTWKCIPTVHSRLQCSDPLGRINAIHMPLAPARATSVAQSLEVTSSFTKIPEYTEQGVRSPSK